MASPWAIAEYQPGATRYRGTGTGYRHPPSLSWLSSRPRAWARNLPVSASRPPRSARPAVCRPRAYRPADTGLR